MTSPPSATGLTPAIAEGLRAAARRFGTPAYVTDLAALETACSAVVAAFPDPWVRQYSVKANDVPAIIAAVAARGFGANVVSRGEWAAASVAGVPNERITLEGIGKTPADLRAAARAARDGRPLRWVALESPEEAEALAGYVGSGPRLDVLYRLNPDVVPETLAGLAVGAGVSKFGMDETEIGAAITAGGGPDGPLRSRGIHLHVGSQLGAVDAWREAVRKALAVTALWRGSIATFDTLDVGGGFPVRPADEPAPTAERFAREWPAILEGVPADRRPTRLAIEPGRALVARSGWLLARVLHVRDRGGRQVILDAGMTELIRPMLYNAYHRIEPAETRQAPEVLSDVVGPLCESSDTLGKDRRFPKPEVGDVFAVLDAGAYGSVMASNYNRRSLPAEVMVQNGRAAVIRRRQTIDDMLALEI